MLTSTTANYSYKKFLIANRRLDQSLKFFTSFNQFKPSGVAYSRISLDTLQPDEDLSVIKSLDFLTRLVPSGSFRAVSLYKAKRFSTNTPMQFFLTLRGFSFFSYLQQFFKFFSVAKSRHTFYSAGFSAKSVNFSLGNLGEISFNLNSSYEYFKWLAVLNSSFILSKTAKNDTESYFFSIFGIYKNFFVENNFVLLNYEAFSF